MTALTPDRRALDLIAEACGGRAGDHPDNVVLLVRSTLQDPTVHNARRARALAVVDRLTDALQNLIEDSSDPGTEALGAVWEGKQFVMTGGGAPLILAADDQPARRVTVTATTYHVTVLPEDVDDFDMWTVLVELRGHGRWSVRHNTKTLGADGTWSFGPLRDEDAESWVQAHRFDLDGALRRAVHHAPDITVNGITPAQQLARLGRAHRRS